MAAAGAPNRNEVAGVLDKFITEVREGPLVQLATQLKGLVQAGADAGRTAKIFVESLKGSPQLFPASVANAKSIEELCACPDVKSVPELESKLQQLVPVFGIFVAVVVALLSIFGKKEKQPQAQVQQKDEKPFKNPLLRAQTH